jgi:hypothetical protein
MNDNGKIEIKGIDIDCPLMFISQKLRLMLNVSKHGFCSNAPYAAEDMVIALCEVALENLRGVVHDLRENTNLLDSDDSEVRTEFDRLEREWEKENDIEDEAEEAPAELN